MGDGSRRSGIRKHGDSVLDLYRRVSVFVFFSPLRISRNVSVRFRCHLGTGTHRGKQQDEEGQYRGQYPGQANMGNAV